MIAVPPIQITASQIISSTAIDPVTWSANGIYANESLVSHHGICFKSLEPGNTGKVPSEAPLSWQSMGTVNSLAMFDTSPASATSVVGGGPLTIKVFPGSRVTSIGLLGLKGSSVRLQVEVASGETIVDETRALVTTKGTYFSWCFDELVQQSELVWTSLKSSATPTITITINSVGNVASCGLCVLGRQVDVGVAQYGFNQGIELRGTSYLDSASNPVRLDRGHRKTISGTLEIPRSAYNRTQDFFAQNVGVPMLWVLAPSLQDYRAATLFGDYEKTVMSINDFETSTTSIDINGYY